MKFSCLLGLLTVTFLSACSTTNKHSDILFIRTSKLVDGVNDSVHEDLDLIVISGRFAGVGRGLTVPENAETLDLKKYTVFPRPAGLKKGTITPGLSADLIAVEGPKKTVVLELRSGRVVK